MKKLVNEQLLASVVRFSEDSIIITDIHLASPGPRIIYVNPGFTKMTGYKPEDVYGKTPRILQGPKTDRAVLKRLKDELKQGKVFFGQAINYRKDGTEFYNEWHIEPIKESDGTITHYIAIQRDVTKRVMQEKLIEQKNLALRELLSQVEVEKKTIKDNVLANVEKIILPNLNKLKQKLGKNGLWQLNIIEQNLNELTSAFTTKASSSLFKLSSRELEISHLIRQGLSGKDIAKVLNCSFKTVETHRFNIRKKLGLLNQRINLQSFLKQLN